LLGQGGGRLPDLGLLGEDANPSAGQVLDQPGVQHVEPLVGLAVLLGRPGQAPRDSFGGRLELDDQCVQGREAEGAEAEDDVAVQLRAAAFRELTVPNLYAVLSAVNAGAGYSVLPRSLCQEYLDNGRLDLLHDPEEPPLNTLFLVQRPGADTNPDVVRVRDRLQHAARGW